MPVKKEVVMSPPAGNAGVENAERVVHKSISKLRGTVAPTGLYMMDDGWVLINKDGTYEVFELEQIAPHEREGETIKWADLTGGYKVAPSQCSKKMEIEIDGMVFVVRKVTGYVVTDGFAEGSKIGGKLVNNLTRRKG